MNQLIKAMTRGLERRSTPGSPCGEEPAKRGPSRHPPCPVRPRDARMPHLHIFLSAPTVVRKLKSTALSACLPDFSRSGQLLGKVKYTNARSSTGNKAAVALSKHYDWFSNYLALAARAGACRSAHLGVRVLPDVDRCDDVVGCQGAYHQQPTQRRLLSYFNLNTTVVCTACAEVVMTPFDSALRLQIAFFILPFDAEGRC